MVPLLGCVGKLLVDVESCTVGVDPAAEPWPGRSRASWVISAAFSSAVINRVRAQASNTAETRLGRGVHDQDVSVNAQAGVRHAVADLDHAQQQPTNCLLPGGVESLEHGFGGGCGGCWRRQLAMPDCVKAKGLDAMTWGSCNVHNCLQSQVIWWCAPICVARRSSCTKRLSTNRWSTQDICTRNIADWYKTAELKAQVVLSLAGILTSFLIASTFVNRSDGKEIFGAFAWHTWIALGLTTFTLVGAIVSAVMC